MKTMPGGAPAADAPTTDSRSGTTSSTGTNPRAATGSSAWPALPDPAADAASAAEGGWDQQPRSSRPVSGSRFRSSAQ